MEEDHKDMENLILKRTNLVKRIAEALLELNFVNIEIDKAMGLIEKSEDKLIKDDLPPSATHKVTPLTPEHKRLLRFKSYSYPFLCDPEGDSEDFLRENEAKDELEDQEEEDLFFEKVGILGWAEFLKAQETSIDDEVL